MPVDDEKEQLWEAYEQDEGWGVDAPADIYQVVRETCYPVVRSNKLNRVLKTIAAKTELYLLWLQR